MDEPTYLGIDFGTSGVRACLIDARGEIHAERQRTLPAPERSGSRVTQPPAIWWNSFLQLMDELAADHRLASLQALAIDGTAGTLLLADDGGEPLTDALMYNDTSAVEQVDPIKAVAPSRHICASASSSLAKLLLLAEQQTPAAKHALHQSDWILGRLLGRFDRSDENNALKLGYDPQQRLWPDWVRTLTPDPGWLPEVVPAGTDLGALLPEYRNRWHCPDNVRLLAGTTDSTASVIATGVHRPGQAVTVLGSTLVLKVLSERPVSDATYGIYSHRLGDLWLAGGASNSGGAVLKQFFSVEDMERLTPALKPASATGLDYYPLTAAGERFPVNDPRLEPRLTPRPKDAATFFQGLLEGIARIEREGYQRLNSLGAPYPAEVFTAGGGARNPAWRTIRTNTLGVPVHVALHQEAAYGSALLALHGTTPYTREP